MSHNQNRQREDRGATTVAHQQPPIGNMAASLRLLPRAYQVLALSTVILVFVFFYDDPLVVDVAKRMHFSFGAGYLWPQGYALKLERMTLHERLCFALYSGVLIAILLVLRKIRALSIFVATPPAPQDDQFATSQRFSSGGSVASSEPLGAGGSKDSSSSNSNNTEAIGNATIANNVHLASFIPDKPRLTVLILVVSVIEAGLAMREEMHQLDALAKLAGANPAQSGSTATAAASSLIPDEAGKYLPFAGQVRALAASGYNEHFIAQALVFAAISSWWAMHVAIPGIIAFLYRVSCDVPARRIASLRWMLVCFALCRTLVTVLYLCVGIDEWRSAAERTSVYCLGVWLLLTVGIVNHTYGPTHRCGFVTVGSSAKQDEEGTLDDSQQQPPPPHIPTSTIIFVTARAALRCCILSLVAMVTVLSVMVGGHVVELLLLWLAVALLALWIPAAIDSFSTDFFSFAGLMAAVLVHHQSTDGSAPTELLAFIAVVVFLSAASVSAIYNTIAFATKSRLVALLVLTVPGILFSLQHLFGVPSALPSAVEPLLSTSLGTLKDSLPHTFRYRLRMVLLAVGGAGSGTSGEFDATSTVQLLLGLAGSAKATTVPALVFVLLVCTTIIGSVAKSRGADFCRRYAGRKGERVILTNTTLVRKLLHTVVNATLFSSSCVAAWFVVTFVLPRYIPAIGKALIFILTLCGALGVLMDMRDLLLVTLLRAVGFSTDEAKGDVVLSAGSAFSPQGKGF